MKKGMPNIVIYSPTAMSLFATIVLDSSFEKGTLEFATHEWLKRERRTYGPMGFDPVELRDVEGILQKASFKVLKRVEPLSLMLKSWFFLRTGSLLKVRRMFASVILSHGFLIMESGSSRKINEFFSIFRVAKAP